MKTDATFLVAPANLSPQSKCHSLVGKRKSRHDLGAGMKFQCGRHGHSTFTNVHRLAANGFALLLREDYGYRRGAAEVSAVVADDQAKRSSQRRLDRAFV